ncbi:hypothetical protein CYMTET_6205 [Cymbomonas tetramitiformis]|uniref:RRM domain-containing protein n=1 Tax=Cymbomonas tetramitiformis TaxID=36881 RepID=A0AAE0GXW5_9CHLO|nr:hypothetical protein CYMTET_6205 [Cymbomonas tetramitiformis]
MSGADDKKAKRQKVAVAESDRRTVFIAGLPESVTDKELRLFFAFAPGYIKVQRQSGAQPLAFALFDTQMSALDAINRIQGYAFEEGATQTLRAELAKGNLHAASDEVAEYAAIPSYSAALPWPSEMLPPGPNVGWTPGPEPKDTRDRQAGGKNPPCDTVVLWGVKSDEATLLPTLQPLGMTNTKWTGKPGGSSAVWVQFGTVEQATAAIGVLHGHDGIRAEYSKNSLNKKVQVHDRQSIHAGGASNIRPYASDTSGDPETEPGAAVLQVPTVTFIEEEDMDETGVKSTSFFEKATAKYSGT